MTSQSPQLPQNPPPAPLRVIVFGDSITEALDLPMEERSNRWTDVVERASNGRLQFINEGKGGRPTDSLNEFEAVLARHSHVDIFAIALGANDARDISETCVPKAVVNIRTMITRAREVYSTLGNALHVLIIAPTNIRKDCLGPTRPIANERDEKLRELGTAYIILANETGSAFVSTYGAIPPESLTRDGVHPDSAGHAAIAAALLPKFNEIVTRSASD